MKASHGNQNQQLGGENQKPLKPLHPLCLSLYLKKHREETKLSYPTTLLLPNKQFSKQIEMGDAVMTVETRGRKILVAVDEGEESMYALSWALKNFISTKDTLILLYAKVPRMIYSTLDGTGRRTIDDSQEYLFSSGAIASIEKYSNDVAECVIEKAKRLCKDVPHVKVDIKVENGDPRDVICEAAEKLGVDALIMGTHGYGVIKRAFLGSVSSHCSQKVKCPVLIVKKPKAAAT